MDSLIADRGQLVIEFNRRLIFLFKFCLKIVEFYQMDDPRISRRVWTAPLTLRAVILWTIGLWNLPRVYVSIRSSESWWLKTGGLSSPSNKRVENIFRGSHNQNYAKLVNYDTETIANRFNSSATLYIYLHEAGFQSWTMILMRSQFISTIKRLSILSQVSRFGLRNSD